MNRKRNRNSRDGFPSHQDHIRAATKSQQGKQQAKAITQVQIQTRAHYLAPHRNVQQPQAEVCLSPCKVRRASYDPYPVPRFRLKARSRSPRRKPEHTTLPHTGMSSNRKRKCACPRARFGEHQMISLRNRALASSAEEGEKECPLPPGTKPSGVCLSLPWKIPPSGNVHQRQTQRPDGVCLFPRHAGAAKPQFGHRPVDSAGSQRGIPTVTSQARRLKYLDHVYIIASERFCVYVRSQQAGRKLVPPHTRHGVSHCVRSWIGVVMILPQVHLRKPCYDFTFL